MEWILSPLNVRRSTSFRKRQTDRQCTETVQVQRQHYVCEDPGNETVNTLEPIQMFTGYVNEERTAVAQA